MGTIIYVWNSTKHKFGHASMMLSDETYISWWPRKEAHSLYTEVTVNSSDKEPVKRAVVVNPSKNMRMDTLPSICVSTAQRNIYMYIYLYIEHSNYLLMFIVFLFCF